MGWRVLYIPLLCQLAQAQNDLALLRSLEIDVLRDLHRPIKYEYSLPLDSANHSWSHTP